MKKLLSTILISTLIMCITACTNKNQAGKETDTTSTKEELNTENSTELTQNTETESINPLEPTKSEEELYKQYLAETKIELLAFTNNLSFDDVMTNGYYPNEYGNVATMITIGVTYPSKDAKKAIRTLEIAGETAMNPMCEGDAAYQFSDVFSPDNNLYDLYIIIVQGNVDASKAHIHIETKMDEVFEDRKFDNDGNPVGFESAILKFSGKDDNMGLPSGIICIDDRHYKVVSRGKNDADCIDMALHHNSKGYNVYVEYRLALLPLEGGRTRSLGDVDLDALIVLPEVNDVEFGVSAKSDNIFGGNAKIHTVILVKATKHLDAIKLNENGNPDSDAYTPIIKELDNLFNDVFIKSDDSDNAIELPLKQDR